MTQKVRDLEKENILLQAKSMELESQIDLCEKLGSQHNLVQQPPQKNNDIAVVSLTHRKSL